MRLFPLYLLLGMLIAALLDIFSRDPHEGEEEQPTHCVPDDVIDQLD